MKLVRNVATSINMLINPNMVIAHLRRAEHNRAGFGTPHYFATKLCGGCYSIHSVQTAANIEKIHVLRRSAIFPQQGEGQKLVKARLKALNTILKSRLGSILLVCLF